MRRSAVWLFGICLAFPGNADYDTNGIGDISSRQMVSPHFEQEETEETERRILCLLGLLR